DHCNRQLAALDGVAARFRAAGIEPVVIAWDPAQREVFRAYRAFDDFEDQPLHGTYLVSADGRILWEDIASDPFMDFGGFLLEESKRLLGIWGRRPAWGSCSRSGSTRG